MALDDALQVLEELEAEPSSNAKKDILRKNKDIADLHYILKNTYDHSITYGIAEKSISDFYAKAFIGDIYDYNLVNVIEHIKKNNTGSHVEKALVSAFIESFAGDYLFSKWLPRIFTKKLRIGVTEKTLRNVFGKSYVPLWECQKANPFSFFPKEYYIEPKADGVRAFAICNNGTVKLMTHGGNQLLGYTEIEEALQPLKNYGIVLDGEIQKDGSFRGTMNDFQRKSVGKKANYFMFDIMTYDSFLNQVSVNTLKYRKYELTEVFATLTIYNKTHGLETNCVQLMPSELVDNEDRYWHPNNRLITVNEKRLRLQSKYLSMGYEGAMIKDANSHYEFKRNNNWQKIKASETIDLPILGFEEGKGKYEGMLGKVRVNYKGVEVLVGGGFSDEERFDIWHNQHKYLHVVIEIMYHPNAEYESLREPRFKRFRYDKTK